MKALFNRFNRTHSKDKVKDPRDSDSVPSYQKEKLPQLPPLRSWPPAPPLLEQPESPIGTPTSITSYKPLPPIEDTLVHFADYDPISIYHSRGLLPDVAEEDSVDTAVLTRTASPCADQDSAGGSLPKTGNGSITTSNGSNHVPKKVASLSPPTPSGLSADRPLPEDASTSSTSTAICSQPSHPNDPRGSMSTAASGPRPDVGSSKNSTQTVEATSTRSATLPYSAKPTYGDGASIHQSLYAATPFSQKSFLPPASWSEGVEEDLVTHFGPRERTRQEALWEIVANEERYVAELLKMKDTFIVPILHPDATSPVASPAMSGYDDMPRLDTGVAPYQLPDALRQCLKVIEDSILAGHLNLSEGLRKRYDEQYPLVRSLGDVFVANSHILWGYADYVLHLERALEQANDVISKGNTKRPKNMDEDEWLKVCTFLRKLENDAQDRGEAGLAISLSKPFQRLLKYPLLLQNIFSHTNPSTFEYERTLRMVAEVENIVRSIEDEKIEKEERDKTRDILARIEGLDKVKELAAPKPSRVLVEERILPPRELSGTSNSSSPPPVGTTEVVSGEISFKRLGGKKEMWLVVFSDVVLRCQWTGTTSLPLGAHASRADSLLELQGKSKYATTGRRDSTARPRNLYKFIKVENWTLGNSVQPREGVVSMEEAQIQPRIVPMPDDDTSDDMSVDMFDDDKSKSNFSNRSSADPLTLQKLITKQRPGPGGLGTRCDGPIVPSTYSGEYSAPDKFEHRLVSADSSAAGPSSRRTVMPYRRRPPALSDEGYSIKKTVTRPAWEGSTRTPATSVQSTKHSRNTSQHSAATRTDTPPTRPPPRLRISLNTSQNSAATRTTTTLSNNPSEGSGVGLYRQMMANDLSLNND